MFKDERQPMANYPITEQPLYIADNTRLFPVAINEKICSCFFSSIYDKFHSKPKEKNVCYQNIHSSAQTSI